MVVFVCVYGCTCDYCGFWVATYIIAVSCIQRLARELGWLHMYAVVNVKHVLCIVVGNMDWILSGFCRWMYATTGVCGFQAAIVENNF